MKTHSFPAQNKRDLQQLCDLTTDAYKACGLLQDAGKQAMMMEAALRLVLLFHSGSTWDSGKRTEWNNLLVECGKEFVGDVAATTKVLCNTIREVLGEQWEHDFPRERA